MLKLHLLFALMILSLNLSAQKEYPQNYFSSPLKIPVVLSGTFGELRSNHFHSGIDIKTQGKENIPIYAPADGYVSRIKVAQYGFGKALYITHPNGYSTVYAHLKKFAPSIQEYVKTIQYQKEKFHTGNLFPTQDKFPVKKGQLVGYTGDSGSSGGPHLHYEIRDTATEHIINPLLFGLKVKDTQKPIIKKLFAFPLNNDSRVNKGSNKTSIAIENLGNGNYKASATNANGLIGLGIEVFDRLDGAQNKNGIYSLEMLVNGTIVYQHNVETFSFSESKYINLFIDYEHFKKFKQRIQKTHKVKSNKLSIYKNLLNNGKINIENGGNYTVEIIAKDYAGNSANIKLPIRGVPQNNISIQKDTTEYKINAIQFNKFEKNNVSVAFPKNTFYKDCFLNFTVENNIAQIHNPSIPLDKKYTLTFDTSNYSESEKQQIYIANVTKSKYPKYVTTKKKLNKVFTTTKALGTYTLKIDSGKPKINLVNFKDNQSISNLKTLKVKISDQDTGIKSFKAFIDDEWILMEFNHKKKLLTYDFSDKKLVGNKHIFKLVVSDNVGNTEIISATFFRK